MKLFLVKRKLLTFGACPLCAATIRQFPIYCVQQNQKVISLSFDAA